MVLTFGIVVVTIRKDIVSAHMPRQVFHRKLEKAESSTKDENSSKVTHIGFLKVHKAGSTTMQNIFFRFGVKHNLTFVLPTGRNYIFKPKSALPVTNGSHRDILACHSVYSRQLFRSVLPNDSINIGIIRDPLQRMISAAYYYRDVWRSEALSKIPREGFIHKLILHPDLYDPFMFSKTRNAMGKDFGFPRGIKQTDKKRINAHLQMLRKDFKLVMVMERFDESLVLMKRDLNWDFSDIIYLESNSHKHKTIMINASEERMFESTSFLDYAVYNFFKRIFDQRVRKEGNMFYSEVEDFKNVLQEVGTFCMKAEKLETLIIPKSKWSKSFVVTTQDCLNMMKREMSYIHYLKERHMSMHNLYINNMSYF